MKRSIKYIADNTTENSKFERGDFWNFITWWDSLEMYQFDIETDITDWWNTRKLISMQFGTAETKRKREQWFIQWSALTDNQKKIIIDRLNKCRRQKLCHNGRYEYIVLRFYGIILENIFDTMLAEKVLFGGYEAADYALADISWKYLRLIMDKTNQTLFGDDIINDSKIEYGCTDVMYLDIIKRQQIEAGEEAKLLNVMALEMEVLPAFSDITFEGMKLDIAKWRENEILARPIVQAATERMNAWLRKSPFEEFALLKGYLCATDRITINFNSHEQKKSILQKIFPDMIGGTKVIIQKYIRFNAMKIGAKMTLMLNDVMNKNYYSLTEYITTHHRDWLIEQDYLIPAWQPTINWNSPDQILPLFQLVEPRLKGTSEEDINKTIHKSLRELQEYRKATKLISQYGEEFIHKYVGPDGLVRTNFNQILTTGRCSSSNPNLQNIVVGDRIANEADKNGLRYRNAFTCEPGWKFVDGDYVSQELVIIAYISKDPVWMECIQKGWDLHSVCADLVYKSKWKSAASEGCAYYNMVVDAGGNLVQAKQKCKCQGHKSLRDAIKPINFGLAYGMTEFKLAGELQISLKAARALIEEYFTTFPLIGATLDFMGNFGMINGWVPTLAPFHRKRYFPYWKEFASYVDTHVQGIYRVGKLDEIDRAAKNHPIQGTSADIVKLAMILVRNYIRDNNLWNVVKVVAQVHDQITTIAKDEFVEEWKPILNQLMAEAGQVVIPTGILKADVNITPVWSK